MLVPTLHLPYTDPKQPQSHFKGTLTPFKGACSQYPGPPSREAQADSSRNMVGGALTGALIFLSFSDHILGVPVWGPH